LLYPKLEIVGSNMKKQGKQERKRKTSTQQQGLRGLGGRIKARNRPEERKIDYK